MFLFDKFPTEKSVEKHNIKKDVASHIAHVFYKNLSMPYFPYYKWKGKPFCVRSYMIVLPNKNSKLYTLKNYDKIKFESLIHQTNNNQSLFNSLIDWNFSRLYMEKNKITKTINLTETSFEVGSQIQPTRTASDSFSDEEEHFYDIPTSLEDHVAEDIYIVEDELQIVIPLNYNQSEQLENYDGSTFD
ncbi:hypothetical protein HZS_6607 [Henneguya salminicola]|nr:hypothetical protein HZS_6607 [Henneguya salminicola]